MQKISFVKLFSVTSMVRYSLLLTSFYAIIARFEPCYVMIAIRFFHVIYGKRFGFLWATS